MIVGQAKTLTFSLVAPSGVTYSSPAVTIESNPWLTSSALTDNGNGTYSITITPDRETEVVIKLKVVQDGKTYYHALKTSSEGPLRFFNPTVNNQLTNGTITFTSQITDGTVPFLGNFRDVTRVVDVTTAKVTLTGPGAAVSAPVVTTSGSSSYMQMLTTLAITTADQYRLDYEIEVIHPLSKKRHKLTHTVWNYKPMTFTWDTVTAVVGTSTLMTFIAKFTTSGLPVDNLKLLSASATNNATVEQSLVVVDATLGKYGIRVTPGATGNSTLTVNYTVGNNTTGPSTTRTFAAVAS